MLKESWFHVARVRKKRQEDSKYCLWSKILLLLIQITGKKEGPAVESE